MDLEIAGLAETEQALQDLPAKVVVLGFARALDKAAGVIAAEVEARAEGLDESSSQTRLSEHVIVKVEVDTAKNGGVAYVGFDKTQDERTGIPQDAKALMVEYGHRMVTHKPGKRQVGTVQPRPFMRPAAAASENRATEVFGETLVDSLSGVGVEPE
jgi:hypothetical protein